MSGRSVAYVPTKSSKCTDRAIGALGGNWHPRSHEEAPACKTARSLAFVGRSPDGAGVAPPVNLRHRGNFIDSSADKRLVRVVELENRDVALAHAQAHRACNRFHDTARNAGQQTLASGQHQLVVANDLQVCALALVVLDRKRHVRVGNPGRQRP